MAASLVMAGAAVAGPKSEAPSGADKVTIPAGPFLAGSTRGDDDERPPRTLTLPTFSIDRTEVTRAAYARCVGARRCRPLPDRWTGAGDDHLPVTGVDWRDAQAYCRFAGGRLPTEAEWEKAARGTDGREYPWGNDADCARGNWGTFEGEGPCKGINPGAPQVVGTHPNGASPYGVLDMGGNVWEWVADKYSEDAGATIVGLDVGQGRNGRGGHPRSSSERRIVRGGSCCSYFVGPRAANRNAWAADHRDGDLGFRCAAGPRGGSKGPSAGTQPTSK